MGEASPRAYGDRVMSQSALTARGGSAVTPRAAGTKPASGRIPVNLAQAVIPRGKVHTLSERCKECKYCVSFCPNDVLELSKERNAKGYHYPGVAAGKEEACVACQFCSLVCPDLAIFVDELPVNGVVAPAGSHC